MTDRKSSENIIKSAIYVGVGGLVGSYIPAHKAEQAASHILSELRAAGLQAELRTVSTIEELQELGYGSIIQEDDEAPKILRYSEFGDRWWENPMQRTGSVRDKWVALPAKVLYRKEDNRSA